MDLEFGPSVTQNHQNEVIELRESAYKKHSSDVVSTESHSDSLRDELGTVYLLREHGKPISTARLVPLGNGHTKTEALGVLPDHCLNSSHCEISRLAFYRQSKALKINGSTILLVGAQWLLEHTNVRYFVAHCKTKLYKRYHRFGAERMSEDFYMDHSDDPYCVLRSDIYTAARAGRFLFPLKKIADLDAQTNQQAS